jgi:hypothetical protein
VKYLQEELVIDSSYGLAIQPVQVVFPKCSVNHGVIYGIYIHKNAIIHVSIPEIGLFWSTIVNNITTLD